MENLSDLQLSTFNVCINTGDKMKMLSKCIMPLKQHRMFILLNQSIYIHKTIYTDTYA